MSFYLLVEYCRIPKTGRQKKRFFYFFNSLSEGFSLMLMMVCRLINVFLQHGEEKRKKQFKQDFFVRYFISNSPIQQATYIFENMYVYKCQIKTITLTCYHCIRLISNHCFCHNEKQNRNLIFI